MQENINEKKPSIVFEFISAWGLIFLYALKGLKYLCFDMWIRIFNSLTSKNKLSKIKSKNNNSSDESINDDYEKTSLKRVKKAKVYKYSARALANYDKIKAQLENELRTTGSVRSKTANIYLYTARDPKTGRIFKEKVSGFSKLDVKSYLTNEGYEVYDIKSSKLINFIYSDSSLLGNKMSTKDLVFWLTQLSTYIKAGITLNEGVKLLAKQMGKKKSIQKVFDSLSYDLSLGESFSGAMEKQGTFFPPLLVNMIKAAEATGTLQETLEDMANYYTEVNNTRKEMISALTYPAIITIFAVAVVTFIIVYVVPQFTQIYATSNIKITGITAFIIKLSDFLSQNLVLVIAGFVFLIIAIAIAYKKIKVFRTYCQIGFMKIPVFKNIVIYKELSIFAKTFASLLKNNVFITESMDILSKITSNEVYKAIMYKTINNIVKGEKISDAFKDHWAVPEIAYYMIVTGENTGQLSEMMQRVSEYYQMMHKNMVSALKSLIEPIMIALLALMVGTIILAVIVPMFQLYNGIM